MLDFIALKRSLKNSLEKGTEKGYRDSGIPAPREKRGYGYLVKKGLDSLGTLALFLDCFRFLAFCLFSLILLENYIENARGCLHIICRLPAGFQYLARNGDTCRLPAGFQYLAKNWDTGT